MSKAIATSRNLSNAVEVADDTATIQQRVRALAQQHVPAAIQCLADIMADDEAPHAARRAAADSIIAHAGAKPDSGKGEAGNTTINIGAMHLESLQSLSAGAMGTVIDHEPR